MCFTKLSQPTTHCYSPKGSGVTKEHKKGHQPLTALKAFEEAKNSKKLTTYKSVNEAMSDMWK